MRCAVYGCSVNNKNNYEKRNSFYSFPKDENMRKQWIAFCQRSDVFSANHSRICSKHFVESDFLPVNPILGQYGFYSAKRLRANIAPTIFLSIKEKDFSIPCPTRGFRKPPKNFTRRCKKQPIDEHNTVATTSSTASDGENLLKYATIKEDKTSTKASGLESHGSDTELTADESFTVLEIIEESEEENKELDFEYENDTPTAKRRKLKGQETPLEDALQCMKTYMHKNKKRDEHSIFGELIAHKIRTCNRSNRDIAIAHHHIENVIFNLTMGVYTKIRPPVPASKRKSELTTPAANTDIVPSTRDLEYNLIIPKTEPE